MNTDGVGGADVAIAADADVTAAQCLAEYAARGLTINGNLTVIDDVNIAATGDGVDTVSASTIGLYRATVTYIDRADAAFGGNAVGATVRGSDRDGIGHIDRARCFRPDTDAAGGHAATGLLDRHRAAVGFAIHTVTTGQ